MISRHSKCEPRNDNYRRLAEYIADASHDGEKCLLTWCAGCWSGDDEYQLAIREVEDTQVLNVRSTQEKTYHLIVSFRSEDEGRLSPQTFKEIEAEFAKALGFEDHQRHCGVHQNTDNIHLHIAYSMIGKERYNRHEPHRDYKKRDRLCRKLERQYGLTPDNGRDPEKEPVGNDAAKAFEVRTGQESFLSYTLRHKSDIMDALGKASDWAACHQALYKFWLCFKLHGNGLVIQNHDGQHSIKASGFDRSVSKAKLEKRFGPFQSFTADLRQSLTPSDTYKAAPIHKEPDRDGLYQQFKAGQQKRQAELNALNQQEKRIYDIKVKEWERTYQGISRQPMLKKHRQELMKSFKAKKRKDFDVLRQAMKDRKNEVKKRCPYSNWNQFLKHEASRGNEIALAILRSKKEKAQPERPQAQNQPKPYLTVVSKMTEIFRTEGVKNARYRIDNKGTVTFTLPTGGTIRDTGREIHFSQQDAIAKPLAEKLAQAKWGNDVRLDGGVLKIKSLSYTPTRKAPDIGIGR